MNSVWRAAARVPPVAMVAVAAVLGAGSSLLAGMGLWTLAWVTALLLVMVLAGSGVMLQRASARRSARDVHAQLRDVRADVRRVKDVQAALLSRLETIPVELRAAIDTMHEDLAASGERTRTDLSATLARVQDHLDSTSDVMNDVEDKVDALSVRTAVGVERARAEILHAQQSPHGAHPQDSENRVAG